MFSFAFARILCSLLQRGSAFAKGFGPIKWRGDRAVALESEGGWGFGAIPLKIPRSLLRGASFRDLLTDYLNKRLMERFVLSYRRANRPFMLRYLSMNGYAEQRYPLFLNDS